MSTIDPRRVKITTQPSSEPVSQSEAKLHCRIDASTEDSLITFWIETARQQCEDISRRAFITRTFTAYSDYWPGWTFELPYPPLLGITSIKYYDDAGNAAVTISSGNYVVDTNSEPGRVAFKSSYSWPSVTLREINGVEIIYTAGYGSNATDVPDRYKAAMLLLIGHYYENRESVIVGQGVSVSQLPQGIYDLLLMDRGSF